MCFVEKLIRPEEILYYLGNQNKNTEEWMYFSVRWIFYAS